MGIVGGGSVDISDVNQKIDEAISSIYPMYKQNNPGAKDQYDKYLKPAKDELDNLPGSQNVKSQNDFIKFLSTHGYDIKTGKTTLLKDLQDIIDLSNTKAK